MVRETGPVNLRLSSLRGEGGDYEAEIRCQAIARTLLGGLKERLRLGGIKVGAQRQVLSDGTEIIVATILGGAGMGDTDSVYINQPVPKEAIERVPEEEKEKIFQETRLLGIYRGIANFDFGKSKFISIDAGGTITTESAFSAGAQSSTYDYLAANPNTLCVTSRTANQPTRFYDRDWNLIHSVNLPSSSRGLVSIDAQFYLASQNPDGVNCISILSEAGEVALRFTTPYAIRSMARDDDGFLWTVENNTDLPGYVVRKYDLNGIMLLQVPLITGTPVAYPIAVSADSFYVAGTFGGFGVRLVIFRHDKTTGQLISQLDFAGSFTSTFFPGPMAWFADRLWLGTVRGNTVATATEIASIRQFPADLSTQTIYAVPLEAGDNQADIVSLSVDEYAALPMTEQELNVFNEGT